MDTTLKELLKEVEERATTTQQLGGLFTSVIKFGLTFSSSYFNKIKTVEYYWEWAARQEITYDYKGLDLVITTFEDEYWAVQTKWLPVLSIAKSNIKELLTKELDSPFTKQIVITNALKTKIDMEIDKIILPLGVITLRDIENWLPVWPNLENLDAKLKYELTYMSQYVETTRFLSAAKITRWGLIPNGRGLGLLVRSIRIENNLGQAELAGMLNVTPRYLSEIETGKPKVLDEKLFKTLSLLGIQLIGTLPTR